MTAKSHTFRDRQYDILDQFPNGILVLRRDMTVAFWNRCLEHWTGVSKDQIIGTNIVDRHPHLGEPKYQARLSIVFEGGPPTVFSSQLHKHVIPSKLRNGQMRIQHTTVTPVKEDGEEGTMLLFNIQDVTELNTQIQAQQEARAHAIEEIQQRKQVEAKLAEANDHLRKMNQEMEQFAYHCSHDLKAPLRTITYYREMLEEHLQNDADPEVQELMQSIQRGTSRMTRLIDGLLQYAMAGHTERPKQAVDLKTVVTSVIENLAGMIKTSDVQMVVGELPTIMSDPVVIEQLFANLINNAVKYGGDDRPVVRIHSKRLAESWEVTVADNGVGISPKYHNRIFDVFCRAHGGDKYQGNGIGLAACKKIVERHGGQIWVESEPGHGAIFHITLPTLDHQDGVVAA